MNDAIADGAADERTAWVEWAAGVLALSAGPALDVCVAVCVIFGPARAAALGARTTR